MKKTNAAILILSNSWGGAEESVYNIAKNIQKKELELTLFLNDFLFKKFKSLRNINLINLGSYNSVKWYLKILTIYKLHKVLLNELKKNNVEVLHAQLETSILALGFILSKINL